MSPPQLAKKLMNVKHILYKLNYTLNKSNTKIIFKISFYFTFFNNFPLFRFYSSSPRKLLLFILFFVFYFTESLQLQNNRKFLLDFSWFS